ncbi:hypothetical protein BGX26_001674 [Mortierella sp. AD094]|nr:hypothetical protein BGX26_001674 [Mortierella sp. AD094]
MVKIFSAAAVVLAAAIGSVQAQYILSSGLAAGGHHAVNNAKCAGGVVHYANPTKSLSPGNAFCTYITEWDFSICQCHQADVTATGQDGFIKDIIYNLDTMGLCTQNSGYATFPSGNSWINGYYTGNKFMSAASFYPGKVTTTGCKPVGCSSASQGLSWRNLYSVSTNC